MLAAAEFRAIARLFWTFSLWKFGGKASRPSNEAERRLLVVSFYATPYRAMYGTHRINKFVKYLSRSGWKITLLTTDAPAAECEQDAETLPASVRVERLPRPQLAQPAMAVPDPMVAWIATAVRAGRRAVQKERPTVVLATVPPYSNALAAAIIAMEARVPLVTDFRDPWSRIEAGWAVENGIRRYINHALELVVLKASARIVMADDVSYAKRFFASLDADTARRITSIPNGYDEEDFKPASSPPPPCENKFIVSYVGTLYDTQTVDLLKHVFDSWEKQFPADFAHVEFRYAGSGSALLDRCNFRRDYLRDLGYLSHRDALSVRWRSNAQIFCQPPYYPHVTSGKIYEMLRIPVPIVAFTDLSGSAARLVRNTGRGVAIDKSDPESGAAELHKLYARWSGGLHSAASDDSTLEAFARERQARQLSSLLEETARANQ